MSRINITNLTFSYDSGYDDVYHNMSISFDSSWKLGFIARNGRGKTTLLKLLLGEYDDGGAIHSDEHFSYFPPEIADESFNTLDVVDEINADYEFWKLVMEMNILGVDDEVLYRPWLTLSHGERTKVALAATFASEHANYILLDEPTTHLDEAGRRLVTEFLASKDGFMLVSHDRELLDQVVDHVLVMDEDGELIVRKGNFTQWKEDKDRDDAFKLGTDQKLKKEIGKMKEAAARQKSWSDDTEKGKFGYGPVDRGHIGHIAEKMMKRSKSFEKKSAAAIEQKEGLLSTIVRVDELSFNCVKYRS
ncbi:MAG: ATP-binding cassette domain-containing protein, partial [Clostridiales Family XIII bacterium]|nr:ATP-binding cassette domain-containing protein [Clostridiales Family XIII bacterium]